MKKLIYMDVCCFNRPFDTQRSPAIHVETEAKLFIQDAFRNGNIDLCWSYMIEFENAANPDPERRHSIGLWKKFAQCEIMESNAILQRAKELHSLGFGAKDALHSIGITYS